MCKTQRNASTAAARAAEIDETRPDTRQHHAYINGLFKSYGELLLKMALRRLGNQDDAEEANDLLWSAVCEDPIYWLTMRDVKGGLCATIKHKCIDIIRKKERRNEIPLGDADSGVDGMNMFNILSDPEAEERFKDIDNALVVESVLNQLSKRDQQIIRLCICQGMDVAEVGRLLNMSDVNVRVAQHRAKRHLRANPSLREAFLGL